MKASNKQQEWLKINVEADKKNLNKIDKILLKILN
jgi:hypothetical protein